MKWLKILMEVNFYSREMKAVSKFWCTHPYRKSLWRPYKDKVHFKGQVFSPQHQGVSTPLMFYLLRFLLRIFSMKSWSKFRTRSAVWGEIVSNFRTCSDSQIIYSYPSYNFHSPKHKTVSWKAFQFSRFWNYFVTFVRSTPHQKSWPDSPWVDFQQDNWFI